MEELVGGSDYPEDRKLEINSAWINDFVLKSMEINTATLNQQDFLYAILVGYMERDFDD